MRCGDFRNLVSVANPQRADSEKFRSGSGMSEKTSLRRPVSGPKTGKLLKQTGLLPFVSRRGGNSQPRALFLPSAAKTRRARRNKLNAEESSSGLKAQPPFSELVVITLSLRS